MRGLSRRWSVVRILAAFDWKDHDGASTGTKAEQKEHEEEQEQEQKHMIRS